MKPTYTIVEDRAQAWTSRIRDLLTQLRLAHPHSPMRHFVSEALSAISRCSCWAVWEGVSPVEATSFPEVSFPHPEWKEVSTHDIPFSGDVGDWVDVVVPTLFGGVPLKAGDRVRLFRVPSPEFVVSGTPPTYQIAIK